MPMVAALAAADDEGRQAHDQNGDEEGVFAADDVADAPNTMAPTGVPGSRREGSSAKMSRLPADRPKKNCAPMMLASDP